MVVPGEEGDAAGVAGREVGQPVSTAHLGWWGGVLRYEVVGGERGEVSDVWRGERGVEILEVREVYGALTGCTSFISQLQPKLQLSVRFIWKFSPARPIVVLGEKSIKGFE